MAGKAQEDDGPTRQPHIVCATFIKIQLVFHGCVRDRLLSCSSQSRVTVQAALASLMCKEESKDLYAGARDALLYHRRYDCCFVRFGSRALPAFLCVQPERGIPHGVTFFAFMSGYRRLKSVPLSKNLCATTYWPGEKRQTRLPHPCPGAYTSPGLKYAKTPVKQEYSCLVLSLVA